MGTAFFALTTVGCLAVLAVDAVPGLSGTLLMCPFVGCFVQLTSAYLWGSTAYQLLQRPDVARSKVFASVAVVGLSVVAWAAEVPKQFALAWVVDEFEANVAELANAPDNRGRPGWVGWYWVDRSESDGEGRAYFRTASHGDGIGPDEVSYGFAKIPPRANRTVRSPFGAARYAETWLFGDWYVFSTSNDY